MKSERDSFDIVIETLNNLINQEISQLPDKDLINGYLFLKGSLDYKYMADDLLKEIIKRGLAI